MISTLKTATGLIVNDVFVSSRSRGNSAQHLSAGIEWLKRAHDQSDDDGVSYGYCLRGPSLAQIANVGWKRSYVETSGYILETFYDIASTYDDMDSRDRAEAVARWLLTVQNEDGSFSNDRFAKGQGIVFDTGQVLFGLTRAYAETSDNSFAEAARRAAKWLVDSMDDDGAFRRNTHLGHLHTYNTRVAWAMLELDKVCPDATLRDAARRNLEWAMNQQVDGYFNHCAFEPHRPPFTHTLAYAIRGLYEGGELLNDEAMIQAAFRPAQRVLELVGRDGFIPGRIDIQGRAQSRSCCLTGNCQLAIIWYKLGRTQNQPSMVDAADSALDYVMGCQEIETGNDDIRGAIKGSQPIWGNYAPLSYPNWATKFFVDAMMMREDS